MDSMSIIPAGQVGDTEKIDQTHRIRHLNHQELFGLKRSRSSNSSLSRMACYREAGWALESPSTELRSRRTQMQQWKQEGIRGLVCRPAR